MLTAFHLNQLQQNQVYPGEGTCHILVDGPKEGNMEHQCYRNDICRYHQVSSISLCSIQEIFVSETPAKGNSIVSCTLLICTHWQISSNFNIAAKLCDRGWWSCYYQILFIPILRTCLVFPKNINWRCWFYVSWVVFFTIQSHCLMLLHEPLSRRTCGVGRRCGPHSASHDMQSGRLGWSPCSGAFFGGEVTMTSISTNIDVSPFQDFQWSRKTLEGHVVIQIDIQEDDIQDTTICLALQIDPHSHHSLLNVGWMIIGHA